MIQYAMIGIAVIFEVFGDCMMKLSNGFQRKLPLIGVAIGYVGAFYLLSRALMTLPIGPVYGAWTGLGVALAAIIGAIIWHEGFNAKKALGLAAIVVGVFLLKMGA